MNIISCHYVIYNFWDGVLVLYDFFSGLRSILCINRQINKSLNLPFIDAFIKLFYNITVYKHNEFKLSLYLKIF